MNDPLGDEPSIWLTGDVRADALLEAIRAIEHGNRTEVEAVRPIYVDLQHFRLNARGTLVQAAGLCIATPLYATRCVGTRYRKLAIAMPDYTPNDEAYVRSILDKALTRLAGESSSLSGSLKKEYQALHALEKFSLQPA